jgi:hypothetical protein
MHEARVKIRWSEVRLAAVAAVAFGAAVAALLPAAWPLMPFPQTAPVEIAALLGLLFGFLLRRNWVIALPFTILVALDPPEAGFAGSIIAFLVLSPFAAAGSIVGIGAGRWLRRRIMRRRIRAALRPGRVKPPDADGVAITATRSERPRAAAGASR